MASTKRLLSVSAVLLVLVLSGCVLARGESGHFGGTGDVPHEYVSSGGTLSVDVAVRLTQGTAKLRVLDPSGGERFVWDLGSPGSLERHLTFAGQEGRWLLSLAITDADGTAQVTWRE